MADSFQSYKVASNEQSSSSKFDNFVQAIEDAINSLDNSNISAAAAIAASKLAAGSNGDVLTTVSGVPTWQPGSAISLVTVLPSTPSDGQECIFVDSTSAPTYQWRLRYVAAKASNKWVYIGGPPIFSARTTTDPQTSLSTWEALNSPSITVPLAGDYAIEMHAGFTAAAAVYTALAGIKQGAGNGTASVSESQSSVSTSAGAHNVDARFSSGTDSVLAGVAASTVIQMVLSQNTAVTTSWGRRSLTLWPRAVGG